MKQTILLSLFIFLDLLFFPIAIDASSEQLRLALDLPEQYREVSAGDRILFTVTLYSFFTTKTEGTGVGLALARQILRGHNGDLSLAHSFPGNTQFEVALPSAPSS